MTGLARSCRSLGVAVVVLGVVLTAAAQLWGWRAVPVLSGSMTPYAAQGALVLTAPADPASVQVGDVVAFAPPAPYARDGHPVMHRVIALEDRGGSTAMTTRGDANPEADPWTVDLAGADLGRAVLVLPWAGWLFMAGPLAAVAVLLGAAALLEGVSGLRRSPCSCPPAVAERVELPPGPAATAPTASAVGLPGVRLPGVRLPGVRLPGVRLPGVRLPGVRLPGVRLPAQRRPSPVETASPVSADRPR